LGGTGVLAQVLAQQAQSPEFKRHYYQKNHKQKKQKKKKVIR
jgi:hypothetical protein